jgi:UDP-N-acetylmuramoyl-L-alanyl-D-glutamate--2,6-diaminopimelate ligase
MQLPCIFPVACHTDNVGPGTTFVVIKGRSCDGMAYVHLALARGATTVVVQHDAVISPAMRYMFDDYHVQVIRVDDTRRTLAILSAQAAGHPARRLKIIGVTGTKGKTTSVFLLEHMFKTAGYATALLSSVKNSIMGHDFATNLTTQQPDYLHVFFGLCVQAGVTHVVMEVAAQAVTLYRTFGLQFDALLFTNFDHEHAEFYSTQEDYFNAKYALFEQSQPTAPVLINADDARGREILAKNPSFLSFSLRHHDAHYYSQLHGDQHVQVDIRFQDKNVQEVNFVLMCPTLLGVFNAYNCTGAAALALTLGIQPDVLQKACQSFTGVPGRMERFALANGAIGYVDYAHNPSSYENLLSLLRLLTNHLIVVFGAGGQRDREKRPIMGAIAARYADLVVLTTDNPRMEDPYKITEEIVAGMREAINKSVHIFDRAQAIGYAYAQSRSGSIIAILGKGADEYQMIGNTKYFFSDRQVMRQYAQ